tara:strand:+ start:26692 stop:27045 length:354 start_codon:yes stop_codon:yes gene_type:complete
MELSALNQISFDIATLATPLIGISIAMLFGFALKDFINNTIYGIKFICAKHWDAGQEVILEGKKARIIKVGFYETVFQVECPNGRVLWRYIANTNLVNLDISRVIREGDNNGHTGQC